MDKINFADDVVCGPVQCPVELTSLCFITARQTKDSGGGNYITSCGTCLGSNGNF